MKPKKKKPGRPSEGRKMVAMRLSPEALANRAALAAKWRCDATEAIERALAEANAKQDPLP